MTKEQLKAKVDLYTAKKAEIETKDYSAEIEHELSVYRKEVESKYESQRESDLVKVKHYLEFAELLVKEAEEEERQAEVVDETESVATPVIA